MSETNGRSTFRAFGPLIVLIADEDKDARHSLRQVLGTYRHRIEIVGEASDVDGTTELILRLKPQVLLLGYSLLQKLRTARGLHNETCSSSRAIVVLPNPDRSQIVNSFRLGAYGVILNGSSRRTWWRSIVSVTAGKYWLGDEPLAVLVQTLRDSRPATNEAVLGRHFGLTQREMEIVQRIANGRSNKQVGQDCSIRERTVKHHLTNIFSKMGVSNRLELALLARHHQQSDTGLLSDGSDRQSEVGAEGRREE